jgi:hypothetical protein
MTGSGRCVLKRWGANHPTFGNARGPPRPRLWPSSVAGPEALGSRSWPGESIRKLSGPGVHRDLEFGRVHRDPDFGRVRRTITRSKTIGTQGPGLGVGPVPMVPPRGPAGTQTKNRRRPNKHRRKQLKLLNCWNPTSVGSLTQVPARFCDRQSIKPTFSRLRVRIADSPCELANTLYTHNRLNAKEFWLFSNFVAHF